MEKHPNLLFVFGDEWRAQAFGYAGDTNVRTPHTDRFARENLNFVNAVSGCPVCTPYRGTLMTGQYPHVHGLVVNDQCLHDRATGPFLAECLRDGGYQTAYVGKWHIDGKGRSNFVPPERRLGFEFWRGHECTHDYNDSLYYAGDDPTPLKWEGYDAISQTREACRFLAEERDDRPFALFVSWGPPHDPYETAPEVYRDQYDPAALSLRPNVPDSVAEDARKWLAGYYAHCTALDDCFGELLAALDANGLAGNTIVVFCSDHGDMLGSQGMSHKQKPWEESIRVPFLIRDPRYSGPREETAPIDAPDIMPTLLSLCGLETPGTVQGQDFSPVVRGDGPPPTRAAFLSLYAPFHQWRFDNGGREFRGLRTERYTYIRELKGPWLLYDNQEDPYQLVNRINDPLLADVQAELDAEVDRRLEAIGDDFFTTKECFERYQIRLNDRGDVSYA